jgi:hypothetical protein
MLKDYTMCKDRYYKNIVIGDTVTIVETEDTGLAKWDEMQAEKFICFHEITEIENESELIWLKNCPYAVAMADIVKI